MIYLAVTAIAVLVIGMVCHAKAHPDGVEPTSIESSRQPGGGWL